MSHSRNAKRRRAAVGGLAFFLLGGTTAAALSLAREPQHTNAAVPQFDVHAPLPKRIFLSSTSLREAYAAGTIDRPIKSILNVTSPMRYGDYRWDDQGVAPGRVWIRVDLKSQLISVFRSGEEIGTAVILYGADGVPTPTGSFPILAKLKDHRSSTYDAPMPYTLRLTPDGVSIHASNVRWGYATHGCIGVPAEFAAKLFEAASVGDQVRITRAG